MAPIYDSLARANGRGSAGKCPAFFYAKTPFSLTAVGEPVSRVAAGDGVRFIALSQPISTGASPRSISVRCDVMSARRANWTMLQLRSWPPAAAEARALRNSAMQSARHRKVEFGAEYEG